MEISSTLQTNPSPQISPTKEGDTSQEQDHRHTARFSRESLLSSLEEIAKETEEIKQELPEEPKQIDITAIKRQVETLDKKQVWWAWIYRGFLMYNISQYVYLGMLLASQEIGDAAGMAYVVYMVYLIGSTLVLTAGYLAQLLAMFRKSLRLNKIAIKIMMIFGLLELMKVSFLLFTFYDYDLYQKVADGVVSMISIPGVLTFRVEHPPKAVHQLRVLTAIGDWIVDFVVTYGGARLYKRYLAKREFFLKQKID